MRSRLRPFAARLRVGEKCAYSGIEHRAHLREQRVVVAQALARAGHHRLEAARLGQPARRRRRARGRCAARRAQRRVVLEAEARHQRLEGDAIADVA